jgi:uncharacterized protein
MPDDHIRYDILVQDALRNMVRGVLGDVARTKALPGEHHFFITFDTTAEGVRMSSRLRAQYPQEMTVVLQHQFWDMKVTDDAFEVGLSFGGVPEKLTVPFAAIRTFADPSVQFTLQFETLVEAAEADEEVAAETTGNKDRKAPSGAKSSVPSAASAEASAEKVSDGLDNKGGAEVVRLDRFRKK